MVKPCLTLCCKKKMINIYFFHYFLISKGSGKEKYNEPLCTYYNPFMYVYDECDNI